MSVILPDWVAHLDPEKKRRHTIFSVHAHPDGTRIATGGLDAKVRVWATAPLLDEKLDNDSTDKLLSTLSRHAGSVLVVRWSHSGSFLASGSDDTVALIWELDPTGAGSTAFGSTEKDVETYRCVRRLSGHESDVADLAWSPHDEFLATVGLDAKICIYSGYSFERVRKLDGHQGFVKGVVWDSVGHFLATASDDKTVKVWRASDWGLETEVKAPFQTSPNSPFFRRPSWSPDGAHLLTANAMNGPVFVASVIMRNQWTSDVSLVGHENAVSVTAFNPRLFRGTDSPTAVATVLALGSIDQSISVWVTGHPRPILVFKDVFERQVTDLSWSVDGLVLYASAADGSVAVFAFTHDQLPNFATDQELDNARNVFGYRRPQTVNGHASMQRAAIGPASTPSRQQSLLTANGTPARLQQEITIKNGKRRIKPTLVGGDLSSLGGVGPSGIGASSSSYPPTAPATHERSSSMSIAALTNGLPGSEFGGNRGLKRKADDELESSAAWHASRSGPPPLPPVARASARETGPTLGGQLKREVVPTGYAVARLSPVRDAGGWSGAEGDVQLPAPPVLAYYRVEQAGCLLDVRNFDGTGSRPAEVSQIEMPIENGQERVLWLDFLPSVVVAATISPTFSAIVTADRSLVVYSAHGRRLLNAVLSASPYIIKAVGKYLMVVTVCGKLRRWNVESLSQLGEPVSLGAILSATSPSSRSPSTPLLEAHLYTNGAPIIIVPASEKAYTLDPRTSSLVCIADGFWAEHSSAWDSSTQIRLGPGHPHAGGPESVHADVPSQHLLWHEPIKAIESEINALVQARGGRVRPRHPAPPPTAGSASVLETAATLRHLETRVLACELLGSGAEHRAALLLYAQRLAEEGIRNMAEDLIRSLLGPVYYRPGAKEEWEPEVLGVPKRQMLVQVLSVMANGRLQALAEQYRDIVGAMLAPAA